MDGIGAVRACCGGVVARAGATAGLEFWRFGGWGSGGDVKAKSGCGEEYVGCRCCGGLYAGSAGAHGDQFEPCGGGKGDGPRAGPGTTNPGEKLTVLR